MIKKLAKYGKIVMAATLIMALTLPSYATVGASDGSAFVTKAEFDAALSDFNARLTTFEAGINSKIDSQVSSYLDRNGIWNGKDQTLSSTGLITSKIDQSACNMYYQYNTTGNCKKVSTEPYIHYENYVAYGSTYLTKFNKSGLCLAKIENLSPAISFYAPQSETPYNSGSAAAGNGYNQYQALGSFDMRLMLEDVTFTPATSTLKTRYDKPCATISLGTFGWDYIQFGASSQQWYNCMMLRFVPFANSFYFFVSKDQYLYWAARILWDARNDNGMLTNSWPNANTFGLPAVKITKCMVY